MSRPRAAAYPKDVAALELLQRIAAVSNESSKLPEAAREVLKAVCLHTGWPVGHAYFLNPTDLDELDSTSVWHIAEQHRFRAFREVTEATPLRVGQGLPGRVLRTRKPEWIVDVTTDDNFPRARMGRDIVVRGGFATPVMVGTQVVAVLEFFSDRPQERDDALLDLMRNVGTQLGRVAERELTALALTQQAEFSDHLIEFAYDAFVAIDRIGRITGWNRAAETMFGWRREDVLGRPLAATIVPKQYRQQHLSGIARYQATGEGPVINKRIEITALNRDGKEFPIELAIWPVHANGEVTFCAFIHDITERKDMVEDLKEADERSRSAERRLVAAQEMAGVGSWEWDIENNLVTWSDQLYRNFGLTPDDFEPSFEGYMGLVHPDDRAMVASTVTNALDRLGSFEFEHRSKHPADGTVRIHHCTGRVIVSAGRAIRMAGTNQDITSRREAEAALRAAYEREREMVSRLRELDSAKRDFVSSVSHELRTPLTSIIGYLDFLMMSGRELTDDHKEMLDVMQRNSQRLLDLIEDLLTQSRTESGAFRLNVAAMDLGPVIEAAVRAMLPAAAEKGVTLEASVAPDLPKVMADAAQFERVMLNLLSNATKFTSDGSIRVQAQRDGDAVQLRVTDTGAGIPLEDMPSLFTPYFRSSNTRDGVPGTGLGLAIVKTIVEEHGGSIEVSSQPGEGTVVSVRLPVAGASASAA